MTSENESQGFGGEWKEQVVNAPETVAAPQGFFQRLSGSFGAILFGLACIPFACWALFANEGRAVKTARALSEGQGLVQPINPAKIDPDMNGKLVLVSGPVTSAAGVSDSEFGLRFQGLAVSRKVEMYQWVETQSGSGQDRKFTYSKQWRDSLVDSSRFHAPQGHENPSDMQWKSTRFVASDAKILGMSVGNAVGRLGGEQPVRVTREMVDQVQAHDQFNRYVLVDGRLHQGLFPDEPRVGYHRMSFALLPEGPATFVGQQTPNGIEAYRTSNGREILLAQSGIRTGDDMFEKAQSDNTALTWLFRALGLLGLFIGFSLLFAPVKLLAGYVPVLGILVSGAVGLVAAAATALTGPLVIAIAWFAYRPIVAIVVLAAGLVLAGIFFLLRHRKSAPMAPATASA